jgi:hypothetical protein
MPFLTDIINDFDFLLNISYKFFFFISPSYFFKFAGELYDLCRDKIKNNNLYEILYFLVLN